jgi:hypothetical protein
MWRRPPPAMAETSEVRTSPVELAVPDEEGAADEQADDENVLDQGMLFIASPFRVG